MQLSPDNPDHLAQLAQVHAERGNRPAAYALIARLKELARTRYVPAYDVALVHAALGERDAAFDWLQRAYAERYGPLVFLKIDPDIDALRADARLAVILRDMRLDARP